MALKEESGSVRQLFTPPLRLLLVIGVSLAVLQQVTGINVFLYYAPEIFKTVAGADSDIALLQTIVVGAVNLLFTVLAICLVDRLGRKPLMIIGASGMGLSLVAIGLAASFNMVGAWLLLFNHGFPFFLYAAFCVLLVVIVARLVPETKGKTLEEIESCLRIEAKKSITPGR